MLLWRHFLILKIVAKAASNFCFGFISFPLVNFLQCTLFVHSYAASRTIFRITGSFQNNFWSHWRLSESRNKFLEKGSWKIFRISKWCHRRKQKVYFGFSSQKYSQNLWKIFALVQKVLFWSVKPSKKVHLVTLSIWGTVTRVMAAEWRIWSV